MNKAIAFIINPSAGFGKTQKQMKNIVKEIKNQRFDAKIMETYHPLHAISLTKEALNKGIERIVVVGGDGTLNEVVNGFFDHKGQLINPKASLAVVPSGSGADFVRTINVPSDLASAIDLAITGQARPCDLGYIEAHDPKGQKVSRYFINVSSFGMSGLVVGFMRKVTRKLGARAAYFMATAQAVRTYSAPTISITDQDGNEQIIEKCAVINFANGQYFGSGMKIAPQAKIDDGLFDIISVNNLSLQFFLTNSYKIYNGTHLELDNIKLSRASECYVRSLDADPVYIETDGELFAELPARYTIKHNIFSLVR